jgi:hypothetical protein
MLATWAIWIHRNNLIFNNVLVSLPCWKFKFRELLLLSKHRAKTSLEQSIMDWLSSL